MTAPEAPSSSEATPPRPRGMAFRKHSKSLLPTPEQSRRQAQVVRSAWRHFGEPGPVIAFLNTRHDALNGQPLHVPQEGPTLAEAVADVSLHRETSGLRAALKKRKPYARRVTRGSSALSWCHLAAARTDVMLHSGQKLWDYAAGSLVLQEAGGLLSAVEDEDFWKASLWRRSVIAARTRPLLDAWRAWIAAERGQ